MTVNIKPLANVAKATIFAASVALSACASTVPAPRTAMLADTQLESVKARPKWQFFRKAGLDVSSYRGVMIDSVRYDAASKKTVPAAVQAELSSALQDNLRQSFGRSFQIVDQAGPGVLRVGSTITSVGLPNKGLNALTMAAVMAPATAGGAAIEAEVTDSVTGERVAGLRASATGARGPKGALSNFVQARNALGTLANGLHRTVVGEAVRSGA